VPDEQPARQADDDPEVEKPALVAHPFRLPVLFLLAFALTVALAAAVLRGAPSKGHVSQESTAR
jgi:hypothetical protein